MSLFNSLTTSPFFVSSHHIEKTLTELKISANRAIKYLTSKSLTVSPSKSSLIVFTNKQILLLFLSNWQTLLSIQPILTNSLESPSTTAFPATIISALFLLAVRSSLHAQHAEGNLVEKSAFFSLEHLQSFNKRLHGMWLSYLSFQQSFFYTPPWKYSTSSPSCVPRLT